MLGLPIWFLAKTKIGGWNRWKTCFCDRTDKIARVLGGVELRNNSFITHKCSVPSETTNRWVNEVVKLRLCEVVKMIAQPFSQSRPWLSSTRFSCQELAFSRYQKFIRRTAKQRMPGQGSRTPLNPETVNQKVIITRVYQSDLFSRENKADLHNPTQRTFKGLHRVINSALPWTERSRQRLFANHSLQNIAKCASTAEIWDILLEAITPWNASLENKSFPDNQTAFLHHITPQNHSTWRRRWCNY